LSAATYSTHEMEQEHARRYIITIVLL